MRFETCPRGPLQKTLQPRCASNLLHSPTEAMQDRIFRLLRTQATMLPGLKLSHPAGPFLGLERVQSHMRIVKGILNMRICPPLQLD
jgi:hypothetical protein